MPTQKQMMTALDAALSAQISLLFSKMASAASGPDPEQRFAEGLKNAASFYDKAADIIKSATADAAEIASAQTPRRKRSSTAR
jgi:hypothetical protein